jgi:stage V sporulation protein S
LTYYGDYDMEELLLRVSGGSNAASLASAISHGVYDGRKVVLRAIGAGAVNQAVKSVAIAQSYVGARGIVLSMRAGFTDVEMPDGSTTAILLRIMTS